jgi:hypothetical protein
MNRRIFGGSRSNRDRRDQAARRVPRGLLATEQPRTFTEHIAVDEFGEMPARKRSARTLAATLGHTLGPWHHRTNDAAGRQHAYCTRCNAMAVVAPELAPGVEEFIYGHAVDRRCEKQEERTA